MLGRESDESDNEGFVSHQIRIDSQDVAEAEKEEQKPQNFQPRYISGLGLLRKEPPECHSPYKGIPIRSRATILTNVTTTHRGQLQSASEVYNNQKEYCLVFSRFKEPFGSGVKAAFQHEIRLNCNQSFPEQSQNSRSLRPWKQQHSPEDSTAQSSLIFDSRFESGNLRSAFRSRRDPNSYTLFMQNDTNTYGFNQWFYFSIRNAKRGVRYTFKIANYRKAYSFFKRGMQPLVFSLKKARAGDNGWYRDGNNISYYPSNFKEEDCAPYYTLEFQLTFQQDNDYLTLSPYPPYSFSRLISAVKRLEHTAHKNQISLKLKIVGHSLAKNPIFSVTLTTDDSSDKPNIVVLARQHSGESWSSFLAEKVMQELAEQKSEASKWTLQHYQVCVLPMVNVDGVIYGNFRCDLAGYDLNRCWKQPVKAIHPQVYSIRKEISLMAKKSGIELCIDMHTHSKDFGAFAYCCVQSENCKALPLLISKISPIFRFPACTFGISAQKQNTARSTVFSLTHNINTLTIELSAFGFKKSKKGRATSYTPEHIGHMANSIIAAFCAYQTKKEPTIAKEELELFREDDRQALTESCREEAEQEHPVDGSDSQPDIDEIAVQVKLKKIFPAHLLQQLGIEGKPKQSIIKTIKKKQRSKKVSHKTIFQKQTPAEPKLAHQLNESLELLPSHEPPSRIDKEVFQKKNTVASPQAVKLSNIHFNKSRYLQHSREHSDNNTKEAERPTRGLNLIEFSLKKLPLFPLDKIALAGSNMIIDEGNLLIGSNYIKRDSNRFDKTFSTYEAMCRPRVRNTSKQLAFFKQKPNLEQELPYLCIMSQTKKQRQIQKMNEKINEREQGSRNGARTFHNSILNGHRPQNAASINKYRERRKHIDALSKMRLSPYTRYDQTVAKKQ